ncbi:hypothetical protein [Methyloglobulus morosus]|uniref:hypothetical protein n=1 Tax=Methyloglobulus morosus TaxID=1410681 RepID=UPI00055F36D3|nr:hypothetical protein [Methyloglobulus morosus]
MDSFLELPNVGLGGKPRPHLAKLGINFDSSAVALITLRLTNQASGYEGKKTGLKSHTGLSVNMAD